MEGILYVTYGKKISNIKNKIISFRPILDRNPTLDSLDPKRIGN